MEYTQSFIMAANMWNILGRYSRQTFTIQTRVYQVCPKCLSTRAVTERSRPAYHNVHSSQGVYLDVRFPQVRYMSDDGRRSFMKQFIDNLKKEYSKNKEMKDSVAKFREETQKLNQTEMLQKAREKFDRVTGDEGITPQVKKTMGEIKGKVSDITSDISEKVSETIEDVQKSEVGKMGKEFAGKAAETISKQTENIGKSAPVQKVSEMTKTGVKTIKQELDEAGLTKVRLYNPPAELRMRTQRHMSTANAEAEKIIEPNEEETGMVLHKDSKWYQSWQNFKDNNQYINKVFDLKTKYDESDNLFIRGTRVVTDKIGQLFGGMFSTTEMAEVLTEIIKVDPNFEKEKFIRLCAVEIIPIILEAEIRGELEVLQDWCFEAVFNKLAYPLKQAQTSGLILERRILDIGHVDVVLGKMMEQGPVLIINFISQETKAVRNVKGEVVEGDPEKVLRVTNVWALCRDQDELDPRAAWKLLDESSQASEAFL